MCTIQNKNIDNPKHHIGIQVGYDSGRVAINLNVFILHEFGKTQNVRQLKGRDSNTFQCRS